MSGSDCRSPCRRNACSLCCVATEMTLTDDDVLRLASAGHSDFFVCDDDGYLRLRNEDGRCVFLGDGGCLVYAHRPVGCRLYPLILDLDRDSVVLDDICPHADEFEITPSAEDRLRRSVANEDLEARRRSSW